MVAFNHPIYTDSEILDELHGVNGKRDVDFRYELLDRHNRRIRDLSNVIADSSSIDQNSLAQIKRTARISLVEDGQEIDYLNDRVKVYQSLRMPEIERPVENFVDVVGRNLLLNSSMDSLNGWFANGVSVLEMSDGFIKNRMTDTVSTPGIRMGERISLKKGTYTISIRANLDNLTTPLRLNFQGGDSGSFSASYFQKKSGMSVYSVTFSIPKDRSNEYMYILTSVPIIGEFVLYDWIKLEEGADENPTWSPAPSEDMNYEQNWMRKVVTTEKIPPSNIDFPLGVFLLSSPTRKDEGLRSAKRVEKVSYAEVLGKNIIPDSNNFTNYLQYQGAVANFEKNVSVAEWGATDATRIKVTGGTNNIKLYNSFLSANQTEVGAVYTNSIWIKNMGPPMNVNNNRGGSVRAATGETLRVEMTTPPFPEHNNSQLQIQFRAVNSVDNLDFIAWRAKSEEGSIAHRWTPAPEDLPSFEDYQEQWMQKSVTYENEYIPAVTREIECYDLTLILLDDKFVDRTTIPEETPFYDAIIHILTSAGISHYNIEHTDKVLPRTIEFEPGTSKLEAINELLKMLNYTPIFVDEDGYFVSRLYVSPAERSADYAYIDDEQSVTLIGAEEELDTVNVHNVFVVVRTNEEEEPLVSRYINDNPDNPLSTVNRGRMIVDNREIDNIADQEALDAYTARIAFEANQVYGRIRFKSVLMPIHGYQNVLHLRYKDLGIVGDYLELSWSMELKVGGEMTHELRQIVSF